MPTRLVLRKLMDKVANATSLQIVYEGALDCLHETLGVKRASVLVYDEQDIPRFVAWSGLSDVYRSAVEGHSPWSRDQPNPESLVIGDVRNAPELAAYLPLSNRSRSAPSLSSRYGSDASCSAGSCCITAGPTTSRKTNWR